MLNFQETFLGLFAIACTTGGILLLLSRLADLGTSLVPEGQK